MISAGLVEKEDVFGKLWFWASEPMYNFGFWIVDTLNARFVGA